METGKGPPFPVSFGGGLWSDSRVEEVGVGFTAKRISRTRSITLDASLEKVFPLFGPIREREWAAGWDPDILFPPAVPVEERMVFKTRSHGGHDEADSTWIVSKYLPEEGTIEYTVFATERVGWIEIRCREGEEPETTCAEITYTYLGLNDAGNTANELALEQMYAHGLQDWEAAIEHYLRTGEQLRHH
jgi:hypothetical protein